MASCTRTLFSQNGLTDIPNEFGAETIHHRSDQRVATTMKTPLLFGILLLISSSLALAAPATSTQPEISYLFSQLTSSGCEFNRNGTWYSAAEASAHLNKKYEYLKQKNLIASTEDFIENAARKSSMSGEPYFVKCKDAPSVESAKWFKDALGKFRKKT